MKKHSMVHLFLTALIIAVFSVSAQTPVEKHGKLSTDGKYLLNEHGDIVQLRGMSFYWSKTSWPGYEYYNTEAVDTLVDDWDCTVLRVAYATDEGVIEGWDGVKTVIDHCIERGVYVVIDWHSHTAEQQQSQAVTFFTEQAQRYKDTPNVIFEIYNEPKTAGGAEEGSASDAKKTWDAIKPYMEAVTGAIRNAGADNLVIIGTPYFCQHVGVAVGDPLDYDNIAYSFHFYAASHGPEAHYVQKGEQSGLENNYLEAGLGRVPVFVSEWGTTHSDGGGDTNTYVDGDNTDWWFEKYINGEYHLSWCNWSVSSHELSSAFDGGMTSPSQSGQIVRKHLVNQSTDSYPHPATQGKEGPAGDEVFSMPGTHPTHSYNNYFGAYTQAKKVRFNDRDNEDVRTADDSCLSVSEGGSDDWVSYNINNSEATENLILRYMAPEGSGTIKFFVDDTEAGEITLEQTDSWLSVLTPVNVPAGNHTLKFSFTNTTGYYDMEWFELTNENTTPVTVPGQEMTADPKLTTGKSSLVLTLPSSHSFTSYDLIGVNGKVIESGSVEGVSDLNLKGLSRGIWFVKLNGAGAGRTFRAVVSGY
ncbi:MAG: cellulase family glycosylhydrolase [Chitinispirillaceae bacterium]